MLATRDILQALFDMVHTSIPSIRKIIVRKMPKDFKRPAIHGILDRDKRTLCHPGLVERDVDITLSLYADMDLRGNTDAEKLINLQLAVLEVLSPSIIRVANRALTASVSDGGMDDEKAYIDVHLHFFDDLPTPEPPPAASGLQVTVQVRE